jgi:hypothetical protein
MSDEQKSDKQKRPWWSYEQEQGMGTWGGALGGLAGLIVGQMTLASPWAILAVGFASGLLGGLSGMAIGRKLPPPR